MAADSPPAAEEAEEAAASPEAAATDKDKIKKRAGIIHPAFLYDYRHLSMLVAYLHFAAKLSDSAPAPIDAWSLRAVKFLAKISRLLMHRKVPVVTLRQGV